MAWEKSSRVVKPGSFKCAWASIRPGKRYLPVPSIIIFESTSQLSKKISAILPSFIARLASATLSQVTILTRCASY